MTDKAYIVANEEQECEVLNKFETKGYVWLGEGKKPTEFVPSHIEHLVEFPYVLLDDDDELSWLYVWQLDNQKIVYDGRKESKMKISKKVYDGLLEWKNNLVSSKRIYPTDIDDLYSENIIRYWWQGDGGGTDANNRLIAIIRWVNGEDVFEIEKPKKWVVRSKETDSEEKHLYVNLSNVSAIPDITTYFGLKSATRFDTKEEAESWANAHQEVVQVESE